MKFFLLDENTQHEFELEVEGLDYSQWQVWTDKDGLTKLLASIDERFGGILEECSSPTAIGFKSFYFLTRDYEPILRMFKRYFEGCGYDITTK